MIKKMCSLWYKYWHYWHPFMSIIAFPPIYFGC